MSPGVTLLPLLTIIAGLFADTATSRLTTACPKAGSDGERDDKTFYLEALPQRGVASASSIATSGAC